MKATSSLLCLLLMLVNYGCSQGNADTKNTTSVVAEDSVKGIKRAGDTVKKQRKTNIKTEVQSKGPNLNNNVKGINTALSYKFWNRVSFNYNNRLMTAGMRSWLHQLAEKETRSFTGALALLKNIENEPNFQSKILLAAYSKNKENFRMILSTMCGSFSIGNPMADYIFEQHIHKVPNQPAEQED